MAQYYTLEEAARVLQMTQDEAKKQAETRKVRTFRDRGTLRYRAQDIDELARSLGLGSDSSLQLGEVPPARRTSPTPPPTRAASGKTPSPAPTKKPAPPKDEGEVFNFSLGDDSDQVELGELAPSGPSSSRSGAPKSSKSRLTPRTPTPTPGSDSDVRLVSDGSDVDFQVAADSDLTKQARPPKSGPSSSSLLGRGKKGPPARPDSGVRILPLEDDSDSDVKMVLDQQDESVPLGASKPKTGSDSDIRLEQTDAPLRLSDEGSDPSLVTEEIDLDAELRKQQAAESPKSKRKMAPPSKPKLPTTSPFELSEADVDKPAIKPQRNKATQHAPLPPAEEDSDNFELTPGSEPSSGELSPLELSEDELKLQPLEDSDELAPAPKTGKPGASGINLDKPIDSGISLEDSNDSADFELTLDEPGRASAARAPADSSSEFELSLDDSSGENAPLQEGSDSEFELSLDAEGSSEFELEAAGGDSSSEFELTLDESGQMEQPAEGESDIFETDFEVPALDEDSGSEAVALDESDTDLESSDFDIALDEGDAESEDESASQVVALEDEEETAEGDETVARPRKPAGKKKGAAVAADFDEEEEADFSGIEDEEAAAQEEDEDLTAPAPGGKRAPAAAVPWGPVPALVLMPCLLFVIVITLMGFELLQGMWGYQKGEKAPGLIIQPLSKAITGEDLDK